MALIDKRTGLLLVAAGLAVIASCGGTVETDAGNTAAEWTTYGQNQQRTFFNAHESHITRDNVARLRFKWRYLTGAIVTASPTVASVEVPGEGRVKVVFVTSWDGNIYALRAANGSRLWSFPMKPQPGASYPYASSAEVTTVAGEQRVYVGGGMTVYCLAAASGKLRWQFDAGTGCTDCDSMTERNEVLASPTVVGNLVYFSMDVNEGDNAKGGTFAVDAGDGRLVWYFDLETGATCRPRATDAVRRFDGYHSAAQLGLPDDFFSTRPGCDFDRQGNQCGNIWSTYAVDSQRKLLYTVSSNCDSAVVPPMPPYDEAIFALTFDGVPVWKWRPREIDLADLDFGAAPNLFEVEIGGKVRQVVGVGGKDGTYYLLDRDGVNEITGNVEPYWHTKVIAGGSDGGILGSAAVVGGQVFFGTGIGNDIGNFQLPASWSLNANDGTVSWSNRNLPPSFSPSTGIPGVVFHGVILSNLVAQATDTGATLATFGLGGPVSSGAAIVDGEVFVGAGTGAREGTPDDQAYQASVIPSYVTALCLADAADCPSQPCDDGNPCTYDFHDGSTCRSELVLDGLPCKVSGQKGSCQSGSCQPPSAG